MQTLLLNLRLFAEIYSKVLILQSIANISLKEYGIVWLCVDTGPHEDWLSGPDIPFDWPKLRGRQFAAHDGSDIILCAQPPSPSLL